MKTKYYRIYQNKWIRTVFDITKRQVTLYNDDLTILGIGLY
jgi:hypothetical protein